MAALPVMRFFIEDLPFCKYLLGLSCSNAELLMGMTVIVQVIDTQDLVAPGTSAYSALLDKPDLFSHASLYHAFARLSVSI